MLTAGFHEVPCRDIPGVLDEATRQGVAVFTLSTAGRTDQEAFFAAVRETLPLDPPLGLRTVWDALSDSIWGGLRKLTSPRGSSSGPTPGPSRAPRVISGPRRASSARWSRPSPKTDTPAEGRPRSAST